MTTNSSALRARLFRHLDGLVTAPVAYALHKSGLTQLLLQQKSLSLDELAQLHPCNEGYMNVALRVLAAQGHLNYTVDNDTNTVTYSLNDRSEAAFRLYAHYEPVVHFMQLSGQYDSRRFELEPFYKQKSLFDLYRRGWDLPKPHNEMEADLNEQLLAHVEGQLIGPTLVRLGMNGMFHKYFMESRFRPEEYHKHPEEFREILNFMVDLGWFTEKNGYYAFTEDGLFFAKKATAYGVTVSYLPMFRAMDELLYGNANKLRDVNAGEDEKHVDREMNVWGSGGAHSTYFKIIDDIIIELFNRPINEQPKGILDMGCGNGAFLEHIFNVIDRYTLRGRMLDEHPLFLVGADYNQAALKVTRANLINADIWAKVMWGDIGDPKRLADDLQENYNIALGELLNVRTFLDHNRIWSDPLQKDPKRTSTSTGAFAHRGSRISNNLVEDNLREHFKKWCPYVEKFGLLMIELHTIDPTHTAANLGKTAATAYDATHGFSDQYIVEIPVVHKVAAEVGLQSDPEHFHRFPNSGLATVSINLLRGKCIAD